MGQFANALFSGLLGWVQSVASGLWGLITNAEASAWFRWVLDNWLPLTLMLCLGGAVIDLIVYVIRWQPYRVWRHSLHRLMGRDEPDPEENAAGPKWIYADGSVSDSEPASNVQPTPEARLDAPVRPVRRVARRTAPEQAYHQPYYPPQWQRTNEQGEQ